jgi:serine/threonine-protein kinase
MNLWAPTRWRELSALYDEAEPLAAADRVLLLEGLRATAHPLHGALRDMLEAARQAETSDFLEAAPGARSDEATRTTSPGPRHPATAPQAGRQIGPYHLLRRLGEGGMAEVWLAQRSDGLRREVALKLPHTTPLAGPAHAGWAQRFDRERDILASLRHAHIAGLLDAGVTPDGQAWLALEYVQGETLADYCDTRSLDLRARMQLFRQVLLAVQHAHEHLVVHRDLKPGNILVTGNGEVRLLDFGIAKLIAPDDMPTAATELTQQSGRLLTPRYASPEQILGQPLGTRSDVYSLGVLLYELLCGQQPYELRRESPAELERAVLETEPRAPSRRELPEAAVQARGVRHLKQLRAVLAPELDAVALRAMAKEPGQRYSSVEALGADVDRWLAGKPVLARSPGAWLRLRKFSARHRLSVALGAAALAGMVGLTVTSAVLGLRAQAESARATAAKDFLLDMFRRADPSQSAGADTSARELLVWGQQQAGKLTAQPALQAELLYGIGSAQGYRGELASAERTLAQAVALYERLGETQPWADALARQVEAAIRLREHRRAEDMLAALERRQKSLPAEAAVRIHELRGLNAALTGNDAAAQTHYQAALQGAVDLWGRKHVRSIEILRGWAEADAEALRYRQAAMRLDEAIALAATTEGVEASERVAMAVQQMRIQLLAGRYRDVAARAALALPGCIATFDAQHPVCRELRSTQAKSLLRMGDTAGALRLQPELAPVLSNGEAPLLEAHDLMVSCRVLAAAGQPEEPAELWRRLEKLAESAPLDGLADAVLYASLTRADAWLRVGRTEQASPWLQRASERLAQKPVAGPGAAVLHLLSAVAREQQGRSEEALGEFEAAQAAAASAYGADHPLTLLFAVHRGPLLRSLGREAEADELWRRAQPVLAEALGPAAPALLRLGPPAASAIARVGAATPTARWTEFFY